MAAYIFTKIFTESDKWEHTCKLVNIVDPDEFYDELARSTPLPDGGGNSPPTTTTTTANLSGSPTAQDLKRQGEKTAEDKKKNKTEGKGDNNNKSKLPYKTAVKTNQDKGKTKIDPSGTQPAREDYSRPAMVVGRVDDNRNAGGGFSTGEDARTPSLVLSCCDANNFFVELANETKECRTVCITEADDLRSDFGAQKALRELRGPGDVLWHSQPCTGGCPWQKINIKRFPSCRQKLEKALPAV